MRQMVGQTTDLKNNMIHKIAVFLYTTQVLSTVYGSTKCGTPKIQPHESRIVGGSPARAGSLPWMAMLVELGNQVCGGSIIADNLILSAAHCFEDPGSMDPVRWEVRVGAYHINHREPYETRHRVRRIIMHEAYDTVSVVNDIAIVVLEEKIIFNDMVSPICLPSSSFHLTVGQHCLSAGWGETRGTGSQDILNQVVVPVVSDRMCMRNDWYGHEFLPSTTFCAGYASGGRDSCSGDSGGPLIYKSGHTWYQLGITSWGYDCAKPKWPGIYTNVARYMSWINHQATVLGAHIITNHG